MNSPLHLFVVRRYQSSLFIVILGVLASCSFDESGVEPIASEIDSGVGENEPGENELEVIECVPAQADQCPTATPLCEDVCVANCSDGHQPCGNNCVDLDSDRRNCGICGRRCENDEACLVGICLRFDFEEECDACPCDECGEEPCVVINNRVACIKD